MPVYWKQRYAGRGQRHRAFVRQQARHEAALRAQAGSSRFRRLLVWLRR